MNLLKHIKKYLNDYEYKITITNDYINIKNYTEIKDYSGTKIIIKSKENTTTINGINLIIIKMLDQELLIKGKIISIEL